MTVDFFERAGTVYFVKDNRKMGHQALVSLDEQYFNKRAGGPSGPIHFSVRTFQQVDCMHQGQ